MSPSCRGGVGAFSVLLRTMDVFKTCQSAVSSLADDSGRLYNLPVECIFKSCLGQMDVFKTCQSNIPMVKKSGGLV